MSTIGASAIGGGGIGPSPAADGGVMDGRREARIASLLDSIAISGLSPAMTNELVTYLRRLDYGIDGLLADVAAAKVRAGLGGPSTLDTLVAECIERTAVVHETAVENMLHGFCEIDAAGRIIYANSALTKFIPDCEGEKLARFFGDGEETVRDALQLKGPPRAQRLELIASGRSRPVLAEFGRVGRGQAVAYAIITDLTEEEEAQRRIHDIATFGILKLDPEMHITYANPAACSLLGTTLDEVRGRSPGDFISRYEDAERMKHHIDMRNAGVSTEYDLEVTPLHGSQNVHVRVRSMPERDLDGHMTGVFATLSPIEIEFAAERIKAEIARSWVAGELFASILNYVKPLIPFRVATLSAFTPDLEFSRMLYAVPDFVPEDRWVAMPKSVRHLLQQEYSCGDDMTSFLRDAPDRATLRDNKSVQQLLSQGLASWFSLRIHGPDNSTFMLSLLDDGSQIYGAETAEKAEKMGLRHAMAAVLKLDADNESLFHFDLVQKMAQARGDRELAALVVRELAEFYGWQNVAIIKVNAHEERFELLEQAEGKVQGYSLPAGYTQPFHTGFLGIAHDEAEIVIVGDSRESATAKIFCGNCGITRSEMCIPIRVEGKIVWILNLEDRRPHAFKGPDREKVERLMRALEPSLEKALSAALLDQVLDDAPDAVVITDFEGIILKCNRAAAEMLGSRVEGEKLAEFFPPGSKGAEIAMRARSERSVPVEALIIGRNGQRSEVLMRSRVPRDEYERRVVVLQDRQKIEGHAEARKLAEVASETRVPLSLVSTFVRQIRRMAADDAPHLAKLADHAIKQLGRVEISYDKVIRSAGQSRRRGKIDVAALASRVVKTLPREQSSLFRFEPSASLLPLIRADPKELAAVVESMAAYMLRIGDPEAAISARIRAVGDRVEVRLFKPQSALRGNDDVKSSAVDEAHARFALDEPRIYQFVAINGGDFNRRRGRHGETLRLTLKAMRPRHV